MYIFKIYSARALLRGRGKFFKRKFFKWGIFYFNEEIYLISIAEFLIYIQIITLTLYKYFTTDFLYWIFYKFNLLKLKNGKFYLFRLLFGNSVAGKYRHRFAVVFYQQLIVRKRAPELVRNGFFAFVPGK